jgi:hypothetical protein
MAEADANTAVRQHLRRFFAGHPCEEYQWTLGPAAEELPRLRVAEFAPGPKSGLWVYATVGAWEARDDPQLEFLIGAPERDQRHVEPVTMAAWYHGRRGLGTGHTLPIGQPWLPGSSCAFFLVLLPYPFGREAQDAMEVDDRWLIKQTAYRSIAFGTSRRISG